MHGMTMRGRIGQVDAASFVERLATYDVEALSPDGPRLDLADYVESALPGAFPLALAQAPDVGRPNSGVRRSPSKCVVAGQAMIISVWIRR